MKRILNLLLIIIFSTPTICQQYHEIVDLANDLDNPQERIQYLLKSLAENKFSQDTTATLKIDIAEIYFDEAISLDTAIWYLDQVTEMDVNEDIIAKAYYLKGFYYRKWDKYEASLEALNKVIDAKNEKYLFPAKVQLGKLYKDRGEFAIAFKQYDDALILAGNDWAKRIAIYEYISFAYGIMGTEEGAKKSIQWLDSLENGLKELKDPRYDDYLMLTTFNKASSYFDLGDVSTASKLVNDAEKMLLACCEDPDFMGLITELQGAIALKEGDFELGIKKIKQGIDLFEYSFDLTRSEGLAGTYYDLADAYMRWGKLDSAMVYIDKAIYDRVYGLNNENNNREYTFLQMLFLNGEKNYLFQDFQLKGNLYEKLATFAQNENYLDSAMQQYLLAEEVLNAMSTFHFENETKIFWRKNAKDLYKDIIALAYHQNNAIMAFVYSEKSKYVILEEHLTSSQLSEYSGNIKEFQDYISIINKIGQSEEAYQNKLLKGEDVNELRGKLLEFRKEEEDAVLKLRNGYQNSFNELYGWKPPNIEKLSQKLNDEESVLLSYFLHDSASFVFVIKNNSVSIKEIPGKYNLDNHILQLRKIIQENDQDGIALFAQTSRALYELLIPSEIQNTSYNLVIIPDGLLNLLPFDILLTEESNLDNFKDLPYLFKNRSISMQLNSKSYLGQLIQDQEIIYTRGFGVAPFFDKNQNDSIRGSFYYLEGAAKEISHVRNTTGIKVYNNRFGEEDFYKNIGKNPQILHLSTHAIFNDENPEQSKLVFSNTAHPELDDLVHLFELKNKKINSELVVLSACNTGNGVTMQGEGLSSIGIAFNYAGSPNIMHTSWSIPDNTSSEIIRYYYEGLQKGQGKNEALRLAKIKFLEEQPEEFHHPYYWAGFNYFGDDAPILFTNSSSKVLGWFMIPVGIIIIYFLILNFRRRKSFSEIN